MIFSSTFNLLLPYNLTYACSITIQHEGSFGVKHSYDGWLSILIFKKSFHFIASVGTTCKRKLKVDKSFKRRELQRPRNSPCLVLKSHHGNCENNGVYMCKVQPCAIKGPLSAEKVFKTHLAWRAGVLSSTINNPFNHILPFTFSIRCLSNEIITKEFIKVTFIHTFRARAGLVSLTTCESSHVRRRRLLLSLLLPCRRRTRPRNYEPLNVPSPLLPNACTWHSSVCPIELQGMGACFRLCQNVSVLWNVRQKKLNLKTMGHQMVFIGEEKHRGDDIGNGFWLTF